MKDPLRIFTKEQLNSLNEYNLRRLKKEFFIPFRFGNEKTIILNKHEVDQITLEAIFKELEDNLDEYLFIAKNKELSSFFEHGDIGFLYNNKQYTKVIELLKNNPRLEEKIAIKLNEVIARICQNLNGNTLNVLESLQGFISKFLPQNTEVAYQKTYEYLDSFTSELFTKHIAPFKNNHGVQYKSEIGLFVNLIKARIFDYLPESFNTLDVKYSQWCSLVVVQATTVRLKNFKNSKKRELHIFIDASNIASRHFNSDQLQYNLKAAKSALNGGNSNMSGCSVIGVVLVIFSIIRIIMSVANTNSYNPAPTHEQTHSEREMINQFYKQMEERANNKRLLESTEVAEQIDKNGLKRPQKNSSTQEKSNSNKFEKNNALDNSNPKKSEKSGDIDFRKNHTAIQLSKHFVGGNWQLLNTKYKKSKIDGDKIILNFETEMIPTSTDDMWNLLPEKVKNQEPGKYSSAQLFFNNRGLNIKSEHLIDIIYNIDDQPPTFTYSRLEPVNTAKMTLSTKRIPYKNFNVKGQILVKETKSGKTKEGLLFSIKYDRANKLFQVDYGKNKINLTLDEAKRPALISDTKIIDKKFAMIINNLNHLHNKFLKEKNWYSIDYVKEYSLIADSRIKENASNFEVRKGHLRYNFTSKADNLAYCELNTKKTAFKYIFDQNSGILKGMIRATTSHTKNEVEQVMVFRQE